MASKTLHMIGNSHIDPVWFWQWEEGMQEVRATFRSALDRMKEFPDFHFTCTSTAFFAYLQRIDPAMMDEIRARVQEGRFEVAGGWWIEPDCNLPSGESFVRQGLYGQRDLEQLLGVRARIGANFDSFGHHPQLPQILRQQGMQGYVFQRPQVTTNKRELVAGRKAAFRWQGLDGTDIPAVSLPGEYTAWFDESIKTNLDNTVAALEPYPALPCCYGVGNHGGGPTIQNIRAVKKLRAEYPELELRFSRLDAAFRDLEDADLPATDKYLDHVNVGCYSVDHRLKTLLRRSEETLVRAENLATMAHWMGADWMQEKTEALWKRVLFSQFHDTLGGTLIEEANDDTLRDLGGVIHEGEVLCHLAMQEIIRQLDIPQKGQPIVLFNPTGEDWQGMADVEIAWFCKSDLCLKDMDGNEAPYTRLKQSCTMVWRFLGGRRRLLFPAKIPAMGVAIYYATEDESHSRLEVAREGDAYTLDNGLVALRLDENGDPVSLRDLENGYESLQGPCEWHIWSDDRDPWGGLAREFHRVEQSWQVKSVDCVERSPLRQVLRVRKETDGLAVETLYSLCAGEKSIRMDNRILWNKPWHQLRFHLPAGRAAHIAECPYGVMHHPSEDDELFMHRFLDIRKESGAGLAVTNDGIYGFQPMGEGTDLLILRSPIYAQGADRSLWMHDYDTYHYMDIGDHAFSLTLTPHGEAMPQHALFRLAERHALGTCYLVGGVTGNQGAQQPMGFGLSAANIRLGVCKKGEADGRSIIRLHETDGCETHCTLHLGDAACPLHFHPYEIKTLGWNGAAFAELNLLEE